MLLKLCFDINYVISTKMFIIINIIEALFVKCWEIY